MFLQDLYYAVSNYTKVGQLSTPTEETLFPSLRQVVIFLSLLIQGVLRF